MPICPWNHLIVFAFGAGACILATSLVGTIAYNGKFGDDNKFLKYTYGQNKKINQMALINVCLALFCVAFLIASIAFAIKQLPGVLQLISWILTFLLFLATILSQIFSIEYTKYGDAYFNPDVLEIYNYMDDDDFKKYLDAIKDKDKDVESIIKKGYDYYNQSGDESELIHADFNESSYRDLKFSDFYIPYASDEETSTLIHVPSCYLTGEKLEGSFPGIDPCNFAINDKALTCIGDWNSENFKNYWCYEYRHRLSSDKEQEKGEEHFAKYQAEDFRYKISVDSFSAFYEINAVFLGLNCAGFVILIVALVLNLFIQPFNTKTDAYAKLTNGGKEEDKKEEPKEERIKAIHSSSESEDED